MGAAMCLTEKNHNESEILNPKSIFLLEQVSQPFKLQPIQQLRFEEQEIDYYHEEEYNLEVKADNDKQNQSEDLMKTNNLTVNQEVQASIDSNICNLEKITFEKKNCSYSEQNSLNQNSTGSAKNLNQSKSILKSKKNGNSQPQSPKLELVTSGSQRSIKKVTFNKKQIVVYSSFRKIKV